LHLAKSRGQWIALREGKLLDCESVASVRASLLDGAVRGRGMEVDDALGISRPVER
jgi:hypothetical protein